MNIGVCMRNNTLVHEYKSVHVHVRVCVRMYMSVYMYIASEIPKETILHEYKCLYVKQYLSAWI